MMVKKILVNKNTRKFNFLYFRQLRGANGLLYSTDDYFFDNNERFLNIFKTIQCMVYVKVFMAYV